MSFLSLRSSLGAQKPNAVVRVLTARFSHDKPAVPLNEPPNDHLTFKPYTLDDLAVPHGDYYEDFQKRNRKYWRHLIQGVGFLAFTIYCVYQAPFIHWNARPPPMPPKEERIKSFWVPPTYWDEDDDE